MILHQTEVNKIFNTTTNEIQISSSFKTRRSSINLALSASNTDIGDEKPRRPSLPLSPSFINIAAADIEQLTAEIVTLPHKSTDTWWQLYPLVIAMAILSAVLHMMLFAVDLNSVNDGLAANRRFVYGFLTWYQYLGLVPWIETCNYALPTGALSFRARLLAVAVGLIVQKLFDAFIVESWWRPGGPAVFPIPFSSIVSGTIAIPFSLLTLYATMKPNERTRRKFFLCIYALLMIIITIFVSGLWAVAFRRLQGNEWQKVWGLTFFLVRLICKNKLMAPIAIKLNPKRWITLCLIVDLIVTRVQVSTFPYIDSLLTFMASTGPGFIFLLFRYYSGGDRLGILFGSMWKSWFNGDADQVNVMKEHLGTNSVADLASGVMIASLSDVHSMSMRLNESSLTRAYSDWADDDDGVDVEDSSAKIIARRRSLSVRGSSIISLIDQETSALELGLLSQKDEQLNPIHEEPYSDDDTEGANDTASDESSDVGTEGTSDAASNESSVEETDNAARSNATVTDGSCLDESYRDLTDVEEGSIHHSDATSKRSSLSSSSKSKSDSLAGIESFQSVEGEHMPGTVLIGTCNGAPVAFDENDDGGDFDLEKQATSTPLPVSEKGVSGATVDQRRQLFKHFHHRRTTEKRSQNQLEEVMWEQRQLFHVIDLVGSEILATITQVHHQIAIFIVRQLPIQQHLNASFNITTEQWKLANIYGWVFVGVNIVLVGTLTIFFRRLEKLERGRELRLNAVVAYIFRDNFWFVFHWMAATGALACVSLINHFGADFTLDFEWLSCMEPGTMDWPGCLL